MPINNDLLNGIITGLGNIPKKSEIDTPTNNIDLEATETEAGLMSAADKKSFNELITSVSDLTKSTNNSFSTFVSLTMSDTSIGSDSPDTTFYDTKLSNCDYEFISADGKNKASFNVTNTVRNYNVATQGHDGLLSKEDKIKLDGISEGANKYVLPKAGSTLGGVKTTSTVTDATGLTPVPIIDGVPYYKNTTDYVLPVASSTAFGGVKTTSTVTSTTGLTPCPIIAGIPYYKYPTQSDILSQLYFYNSNLLINSDFKINQRGKSEYSDATNWIYTVDRWQTRGRTSVTVEDDGIKITALVDCNEEWWALCQPMEILTAYSSEVHTVSVDVIEYTGNWFLPTPQNTQTTRVNISHVGISSAKYGGYLSSGTVLFGIGMAPGTKSGDYIKLKYAKAEVGAVPTAYMPPDPVIEMARCRHYYYRTPQQITCIAPNTNLYPNYIITNTRFPVTMRRTPEITLYTIQGSINAVHYWANGEDAITGVVPNALDTNVDGFGSIMCPSASSFTNGVAYAFFYEADAEIK